MLPGSTFSDNPLAASAVAATVTEMKHLDMGSLVGKVEQAVRSQLASLKELGVILRGRGALWVLELPASASAVDVQATALFANVVLSAHGQHVRLLPPATISANNLHKALNVVNEACFKALKA